MAAPAGPQIVPDVLGLIFQYIDLRHQARCAQVCKAWLRILFKPEYKYGQIQALRALNKASLVDLTPFAQRTVLGAQGTFVLLSDIVNQALKNLRILDIQTGKVQVLENHPCVQNLRWAFWVSDYKFVTISSLSVDKGFSQNISLWEITQKTARCITQRNIETSGQLFTAIPLRDRLFLLYGSPHPVCAAIVDLQYFIHCQWMDGFYSLRGPIASNSNIVFIRNQPEFIHDDPGLSALRFSPEGKAELAWKVEKTKDFRDSQANENWFVAKSMVESPIGFPSLETYHVFNISKGKEIFAFNMGTGKFWLKEDFLIVVAQARFVILHLPTQRFLTSIEVEGLRHASDAIHAVQIDKEALRIVYEDTKGVIKVCQLNLENQFEKPRLPPPRAMTPTKWEVLMGYVYTVLLYPLRLWRLVRNIFNH